MDESFKVRIDAATRSTPIYVLGDSHVLGFKNLFVRDSFTGGDYHTLAHYFEGLAGPSVFARGTLDPAVVRALEHEGILKEGRATYVRTDKQDLAAAYASGLPQTPPLILFFCGDIDLRGNFLQYLKDECDLILPSETVYPATDKPPLPYDIALSLVRTRLEPLLAGLKLMHQLGLVRTYLHTIAPPTMNAALFRQVHGFDCPVATRYKAAWMYNQFLAEECKKIGVPLVDLWPEVTLNGYLRPEYELDGVHLAREANVLSLRAMIDHALNNTPPIRNVERYRLLHEMATGKTGQAYDPVTGINTYGRLPEPEPIPAPTPAPTAPAVAAALPPAVPPPPPPPPPSPSSLRRVKRLVGRFIPQPARHQLRSSLRQAKRLLDRYIRRPVAVAPAAVIDEPIAAAAPVVEKPAPVPGLAGSTPAPSGYGATAAPVVENDILAFQSPDRRPSGPDPDAADPLARAAWQFKAEWVCSIDLGREIAEKWKGHLDYSQELVNHHARLDWAGNGIAPYNQYIRTAVPPPELLDDVRRCFSSERFTRFFQDCFGCLVTFINFRPFLSLPHADKGVGPQSWHGDGCPPGVFRAVVYLTDVDAESGPFEYLDADKKRHSVAGPAGTLLLFDANRLLHRGSPPKSRERKVLDVVIAPRLADQPFTVLWTGLNNWPADPFQYSVNGMRASPPLCGSEMSYKPWLVAAPRAAA